MTLNSKDDGSKDAKRTPQYQPDENTDTIYENMPTLAEYGTPVTITHWITAEEFKKLMLH